MVCIVVAKRIGGEPRGATYSTPHLEHASTASLVQIPPRFCCREAMKKNTKSAYLFGKVVCTRVQSEAPTQFHLTVIAREKTSDRAQKYLRANKNKTRFSC